MKMQRRSFLTYLGVGWAVSCFPLVLSACNQGTKKAETAATGGFTIIGSVADLDRAGAVGNEQVLVVRDPANKAQVLAVNPTCTHKGCAVKWKASENHFECPCHDSDFAPDGKVLKGPASKPLATYVAKIAGEKVLVKLA
jgi:cytochrome b6-f complex iron-sulfur subunit